MWISKAIGVSESLGSGLTVLSGKIYYSRGLRCRKGDPMWLPLKKSGILEFRSNCMRAGRLVCQLEEKQVSTPPKSGGNRVKNAGRHSAHDTRMKRLESVIDTIDKLGPSDKRSTASGDNHDGKGSDSPSSHQLTYGDERSQRDELGSRRDSRWGKKGQQKRIAAVRERDSRHRYAQKADEELRTFPDHRRADSRQESEIDDVDPDGDMGRGACFLRESLLKSGNTPSVDMVIFPEPPVKSMAPVVPTRSQRAGGRLVRESDKLAIAAPWKPACYGCGIVLQTISEQEPGYVEPDKFELKKKHHQLRNLLCGRCVELSQGRMVAAVGGHGGYGDGPGFLLASELRSQLAHLKSQKALIIKLVDIIDFNGSFLSKVRDLVGPNPIILVLTKVDLLPRGTDLEAIGDWVLAAVAKKKLNVISVHLTSAKAELGISSVAGKLRERQGRDVYVVGAANVGKSAFVSALLEEMAGRDPAAAAARRRKPIQSAMPGTTLGHISIKAFSGGGELFDTPGVHLHHRVAAVVSPDDLPALAPRRRLKGFTPRPPTSTLDEDEGWEEVPDLDATSAGEESELVPGGELSEDSEGEEAPEEDREGQLGKGGMMGCSLFWGGLVRIDVLQAPATTRFTFMGPGQIRIRCVPTAEADDFYRENVGSLLVPPTKVGDDATAWEGLPAPHPFTIPAPQDSGPAADIAISGLGWVAMTNDSASRRHHHHHHRREQASEGEAEVVRLQVWTPRGVEVYMRPPMPVGPAATLWYRWRELPEEDGVEPPVFFEKEKVMPVGVLQP